MRRHPKSRAKHISGKSADTHLAVIEAAKKEVDRALNAEYRLDPIFDSRMARVISFATRILQGHGRKIEFAMSETLTLAGMEVLRNQQVPVTRQALELVTAKNYPQNIGRQIDFDEDDIVERIDIDLLAIDETIGWAGGFNLKRGGGQTESRKRKFDALHLRALDFTLPSYVRHLGYEGIEVGAVAVIDYYGQSGFPSDLTLTREDLDDYFKLEIVSVVEAMTDAMHDAADVALKNLLVPVYNSMTAVAHIADTDTSRVIADPTSAVLL